MTTSCSLPIGIFDSGLGGLTVLTQLRKQLPQESVVYFADTARVPYGGRPKREIELFVREILAWLQQQPVKMIIMACNTSSALVLDQLRPEIPVPMLGLILPGARAAVGHGCKRVGLIATQATVNSGAYERAILEADPQVDVKALSCPEFVPLIEQGACDPRHPRYPELRQMVQQYLRPLQAWQLDGLVYGCTHYPLLDPIVQTLLSSSIKRIDPAVSTVKAAAQELKALGLASTTQASYRFAISGNPQIFRDHAQCWLPKTYTLEQVQWDLVGATQHQSTAE